MPAPSSTTANTTAYIGAGTDHQRRPQRRRRDRLEPPRRTRSDGSTGGGVISANDAETSAKVTFANETYIGDGASVTAGDAIGIYANSTARGTNNVYAESWGVGAGADADNTHNTDDAGVHITGTTRTRIGEGVTITGTRSTSTPGRLADRPVGGLRQGHQPDPARCRRRVRRRRRQDQLDRREPDRAEPGRNRERTA